MIFSPGDIFSGIFCPGIFFFLDILSGEKFFLGYFFFDIFFWDILSGIFCPGIFFFEIFCQKYFIGDILSGYIFFEILFFLIFFFEYFYGDIIFFFFIYYEGYFVGGSRSLIPKSDEYDLNYD